MGDLSNVGARPGKRKKFAAAVLAGLAITLAAFFAGTWAGSSGVLTLTSGPAKTPSGATGPDMQNPMSGMMCSGGMHNMMENMMKTMMKDMPDMPLKPGQMPNMPNMPDMPMKPGQMPNMPTR